MTKTSSTKREDPVIGCGILGKYPVLSVLLFALVGIGIGVGLSFWKVEDESKNITLKWLGLLGDLFIRSLKAVVLPLVFVNVVLSVVDMIKLGRTGSVAGLTVLMYFITTLIASVVGLLSILCFQGLFQAGNFEEDAVPQLVQFGCSDNGYYLTENSNDGTLTCMNTTTDDENTQFIFKDVSDSFAKQSTGGGTRNDISLSDTFYDGIFTKIFTSNIMKSFVEGNFAAVVFFAIVFGIALGKQIIFKEEDDEEKEDKKNNVQSYLLPFLKEVNEVLITIINWIIALTPFAVLSLIIKAVGSQDDLAKTFKNVAYLMAAAITAMILHFIIVDIGLLAALTKSNPFTYLKHILPAQTTAFASASSAATIPVTLRSVFDSKMVPETIGNFVIPLGATVNMDGGAIYFPCACIWLAFLNGITPTVDQYFLLIILATVGSAGTAPVPSASLVLIITAYNTVFNSEGTPDGFEFILAIDWFMDRLRTTLNVTGDAVVSRIVAEKCSLVAEDTVALPKGSVDEDKSSNNIKTVEPPDTNIEVCLE
eukprot:CAMPEP_0194132498 /NCGR_PEP_ID=MMETSP0152-20130528/2953_1 /TAXON_ID=1049557 /ORGANISM="Thalassiothrix antarctica, Strain L6-D1" /LENGTH=537 /DNA_ID=CAMNT_0038827567 /DNA_START=45 /DNA_END=1658 /DNA_ORIENTATION=-